MARHRHGRLMILSFSAFLALGAVGAGGGAHAAENTAVMDAINRAYGGQQMSSTSSTSGQQGTAEAAGALPDPNYYLGQALQSYQRSQQGNSALSILKEEEKEPPKKYIYKGRDRNVQLPQRLFRLPPARH